MNQKDYKEIAMVMYNYLPRDITNRLTIIKLADYFEREDKPICQFCKNPVKICNRIDKIYECLTCNSYPYSNQVIKFNRQQFLKDCGVEK